MTDFFSVATCYEDAEIEDEDAKIEDVDARHFPDFYENTYATFEEDSRAAARAEKQARVDELLKLAVAKNTQAFDYVAANVEYVRSRGVRYKLNPKQTKYVEIFHAVARLAMERKAPALFVSWLTGTRTDEMRELVGAELKARLRPAQMILEKPVSTYAKRKHNAALRAAGVVVKMGRPKRIA